LRLESKVTEKLGIIKAVFARMGQQRAKAAYLQVQKDVGRKSLIGRGLPISAGVRNTPTQVDGGKVSVPAKILIH